MKGKGLRKRLFYGVGFARTTGQGMNRNGRTQFAPTAGFASAEGWDTSRKRANTVRPYATPKEFSHNPKNIPTTQKMPTTQKKIPRVHRRDDAGNPVIHRNPSITPFQGRVSGWEAGIRTSRRLTPTGLLPGGSFLCKPGSHSRLSTKQKHGAPISENSFCCDRAIQARLIRRVICRFPFSANMSCADSFNG